MLEFTPNDIHLIAAAPELYEALEANAQFLVAWQFEYGKPEYASPEFDEQRKRIHDAIDLSAAALAKARGEQ